MKTWLHPGGRHEGSGPPVRVAFRAYAANSWDKAPTELKRYRKNVAIQWTADGAWEWRENDEPAHQWTYFGDRWDFQDAPLFDATHAGRPAAVA